MSPSFKTLRAAMVDSQLRPNGVNDPAIVAAFAGVARETFVPERLRAHAYLDAALEIAPGRRLLEPMLFANLVMRAAPTPADRALVVAAGGGYEAAVLARLVGEVVALEADAALADAARAALAGTAVTVVEGPPADGWGPGAPYDIILVAGAFEVLPDALTGQLAPAGRLVGVRLDDGVGRAVIGREAGGALGLTAFMDGGAQLLDGFARPRRFTF